MSENDYLGALVLDGLPAADAALRCAIMFTLDAECLLKVYVAIPQLNLKSAVTLVTHQTPDEVIAQMGVRATVTETVDVTSASIGDVDVTGGAAPGTVSRAGIGDVTFH